MNRYAMKTKNKIPNRPANGLVLSFRVGLVGRVDGRRGAPSMVTPYSSAEADTKAALVWCMAVE